MNVIPRDTLEAMQQTHPIEAAIWKSWIAAGTARIAENTGKNEELKCNATA
jgi:hypothetical protein